MISIRNANNYVHIVLSVFVVKYRSILPTSFSKTSVIYTRGERLMHCVESPIDVYMIKTNSKAKETKFIFNGLYSDYESYCKWLQDLC